MPGIELTPPQVQAANLASITAANPTHTTQVQSISDAWKRFHVQVPQTAFQASVTIAALNAAGWL